MNYFAHHVDLFEPVARSFDAVNPWRPRALDASQWPPDYKAVYAWRIATLAKLRSDPSALEGAKRYYKTRPGEFIMHWCDTYDPRKTDNKWMPFVFFNKQMRFIDFLHELRLTSEDGLIEKSRDMGMTWGACAYSIWSWLFIPNDSIGWGSRKEGLVDTVGDPDSIFEKMRLLVRRLPDIFLPIGFKDRFHATYMKFINPENGATITGEAGDNIGRGGRSSMYFKDESAHYERPEKIEAALGDNTNVQIDISSVNGPGNVFYRRRKAGLDWFPGCDLDSGFVRVFVADWSDHPEKTQEWYDRRKAKAVREGMQHIFAQEVDRDYTAALQNRIIDYEWITAAVDAHLKIPCLMRAPQDIPQLWGAGLDVADEGLDRNALALKEWIILRHVEDWGERDQGVTTRRMVAAIRKFVPKGVRLKVQADLIGVGAGVKTEYNRLVDDKLIISSELQLVFWNAGGAIVNPYEHIIADDDESPLNKDFYGNFKAQGWWSLRTRFYKTWRAVTLGEVYPADDLISIDSRIPVLEQLKTELSQSTKGESTRLQLIVNKKPKDTKSPNLADAVVQVYFPVPDMGGTAASGGYAG